MHTRSAIALSILALTTLSAAAQPLHPARSGTLEPRPLVRSAARAWTHLGGDAAHRGAAAPVPVPGATLGAPEWTTSHDTIGPIAFTPHSGVVADTERVYASAPGVLAAYDAIDGTPLWSAQTAPPILDSWPTPAIDERNGVVIAASGFELAAFDRVSGALVWNTDLGRPLVNASPCVYDAPGPADRVFITDYSFAGAATGTLICVNSGPFDPLLNPHTPGDIVWEAPLPGETSGNTPSVHAGVVYVSTYDDGSGGAGRVLAFDADAASAPAPLWVTPNPEPLGFFSPVSVHNGSVYASSYNFFGAQRSANTIKLDAASGALVWSVPSVRTNAAPVIAGDSMLIVSGGLPVAPGAPFFGAAPSIELIFDLGAGAVTAWDSFGSTHDDLDADGLWDPGEEFLSIGGWGHTPVALAIAGTPMLLVGVMDEPEALGPLAHGAGLRLIDLTRDPRDPGFVVSSAPDAGTTPAIVGDRVYSTSSTGLHAFVLAAPPQPIRARGLAP